MLFESVLPSFNTLMHYFKFSFECKCSLLRCNSMLVSSMLAPQLTSKSSLVFLMSLYSSLLFYLIVLLFLSVCACVCVCVFRYLDMDLCL